MIVLSTFLFFSKLLSNKFEKHENHTRHVQNNNTGTKIRLKMLHFEHKSHSLNKPLPSEKEKLLHQNGTAFNTTLSNNIKERSFLKRKSITPDLVKKKKDVKRNAHITKNREMPKEKRSLDKIINRVKVDNEFT